MQITNISESLSIAISCLEEFLNNNNDSEVFIESLKKYKQTKNIDEIELI